MRIRRERAHDLEAVDGVHRFAFADQAEHGAEPVEVGLVRALRADDSWVPPLSLVAEDAIGSVVGHVVATTASLPGCAAVGLGPIGVLPDHQGSGVGAALMHAVPGDVRVREAIDQARAFATGDLDVGDAVRNRGGEAGAAAREAPTAASTAAAYAAEQAAAVAHMGAHALGAAGYAAKASTLAAGCDVTKAAAHCRLPAMSDAVARSISLLPALGENRSGPLGPGRMSGGHVGEAIRALQAQLKNR